MSEHVYASILIGGRLTKAAALDLAEALDADNLVFASYVLKSLANGDDPAEDEDLEFGCVEDGALFAAANETAFGEFVGTETKCHELGLTFVRKSDGAGGTNAETCWRVGPDGLPETAVADGNGDIVVSVDAVRRLLEESRTKDQSVRCRAASFDWLAAELEKLLPNVPRVPPLEIVEDEEA